MTSLHSMHWVFIGLSITSSWGNGHATTYRALIRSLKRRGHRISFLECDVPWYSGNRDMPAPPFCETYLYTDAHDLATRFTSLVAGADVVIVGSYVQDGVNVGHWAQQTSQGVIAFYDIDTPVTLAKLARQDYEYLSPGLIPNYHLYLSFSGGKALEVLEKNYGSPCARPLYCSVDPDLYFPEDAELDWDLGYLGTYSNDRQPGVNQLLIEPARQWNHGRFVVAGPQYPDDIDWPQNVHRISHLPPSAHRHFYCAQRFTLNITRTDMKAMGHSPSVRLFEAAACGTPIISDWWTGLDEIFAPDEEILITRSDADTLQYLRDMPEHERVNLGAAARARVMHAHTADHRAAELENYVASLVTDSHSTHETADAAQG